MVKKKEKDLRYEDAPDHAKDLLKKCIKERFPNLGQANILFLMDTKKRESQGMITLGRILKTNDLTRHLTIDESGSDLGYDYIVFFDKLCWDNMKDVDRMRLMSHELSHTDVDVDTSKFKIRAHTIEDFYSEVERNQDDPQWRRRVGDMLVARYEAKDPQQPLPM